MKDHVLNDGRGGFVAVAIFGLIIVSAGMGAYVAGGASTTAPYPTYYAQDDSKGHSGSLPRSVPRRPCEKMAGNEDADLCAQWRAAAAAEKAAFWNFLQMLVSIFGLGGLFVTLLYNRRTINIADETQREGQRIGQASVRCYLDLRKVSLRLSGDGIPSVSLRVRNDGVSPAKDLTVYTAVKFSILADGYTETIKSGFPREIKILGVGRTLKINDHPSRRGITMAIKDAIADPDKRVAWWAIVIVKYTDVFGNPDGFSHVFAGRGNVVCDASVPTHRTDEMDAILRAEVIRRQHLGTWTGDVPE